MRSNIDDPSNWPSSSTHPMGSSGSTFDHNAHRKELLGDVRGDFDREAFKQSVNERRATARSKFDRETIIRAYVLGNRDDMTYAEVAEQCGEMHPNTVGKIVRGDTQSHITRDIEVDP